MGKSGDAFGSAAGVVTRDPCAAGAPAAAPACYLVIHRSHCSTGRGRRPRRRCASGWASWRWPTARWGSPRFTWRLRREGWEVNHKRIERLVREDGCSWASAPAKRVAVSRDADADADPPGPALEHGLRARHDGRGPPVPECGRWWMTPPAVSAAPRRSVVAGVARGRAVGHAPGAAPPPLAIVCDNGPGS
ncbi:MAG: transposase [Gemmatimonadetes bacterium]|nr:transposase [Gemmatimonadota bacterium]